MSVDRYNSDLYQKLKASVYASSKELKTGTDIDEKETEINGTLTAINDNTNNIGINQSLVDNECIADTPIDSHSNQSKKNNDSQCVEDFHSSLDSLRNTIIKLFEQYNLKYSANSAVQFSVSQCRNSFVRVCSRLQSQIQSLVTETKQLKAQLSNKNTAVNAQIDALSKEHDMQMRQLQLKCDRQLKKAVEKAIKEKSVEMEKQFQETVKIRARQQMTQIRDSQSKEIKHLKKELNGMQSKLDNCEKEWQLKCKDRDLIIEQCRTEIEKMRKTNQSSNYEWNTVMKECKTELDLMKVYFTEMKSDQMSVTNRDFDAIETLHSSLTDQNDIWRSKEETYQSEVQNLERHLSYIKSENSDKLAQCRLENERILDECKQRMETVLQKKDTQIRKLKRCIETTISEYEKEKKETNQLLQIRDEQMKDLTQQLQL